MTKSSLNIIAMMKALIYDATPIILLLHGVRRRGGGVRARLCD